MYNYPNMREFFKNYFFFRIPFEQKVKYRDRVMKNDHNVYRALLIVIMILQAIMLSTSFISRPTGSEGHVAICYRAVYALLFTACFICYFLMRYFFKKGRTFAYFLTVTMAMLSIMLWGVCISLLDSLDHTDLTYFVITIIACSSFICLEPWVSAATSLLSAIIFDVLFAALPSIPSIPGFGFFMGTATAIGAGLIGATFNFFRRINAIKLEFEVSELNGSLHKQAYVDDLTQVHNRRYLTNHIDDELRYGTPGAGIMMIDLDHFKNVNDTWGHQVGDSCLSMLGKKLNKLMESHKGYVLRYGGEEFLVYFEVTTEDELLKSAEELRKTIEKSSITVPGGNKIHYTISVGLALAKDDISYNDLINEADKALYRAKKTRNTISY